MVKMFSSGGVGQQAVVPDTHQTRRHEMQQKASQEFVDLECHQLTRVTVGPVSPTKGHTPVLESDEALVGNGGAVGVASEIAQDLLGSGKRRLGIDDPVLAGGCAKSSVRVRFGGLQTSLIQTQLDLA